MVSAVFLGCQTEPSAPVPSPYTLPTHEVTNGVCIVFADMPSPNLVSQLTGAGATISASGTVFLFDVVNTDLRRLAVQAALLNGASLKGASR